MKTKLTRKEAQEKIEDFFSDVENKTPEEIRKIKRLSMHHNIKLKGLRKKFCRFCYSNKLKVKRIKNKIKSVECEKCGKLMRWRI